MPGNKAINKRIRPMIIQTIEYLTFMLFLMTDLTTNNNARALNIINTTLNTIDISLPYQNNRNQHRNHIANRFKWTHEITLPGFSFVHFNLYFFNIITFRQ